MLTRKKRGPKPTGKGTLVGIRLQPDLLEGVDKFAREQQGASRPEALRRIIKDWLIGHGYLKN